MRWTTDLLSAGPLAPTPGAQKTSRQSRNFHLSKYDKDGGQIRPEPLYKLLVIAISRSQQMEAPTPRTAKRRYGLRHFGAELKRRFSPGSDHKWLKLPSIHCLPDLRNCSINSRAISDMITRDPKLLYDVTVRFP
jgi:hypothetical protein